jgi:hypothetical protein
MISPSCVLCLLVAVAEINCSSCFSIDSTDIKSILQTSDDTTTLPRAILDKVASSGQCLISTSSDFQQWKQEDMSSQEYYKYAESRHLDCVELFDRYQTKLLRCEELIGSSRGPSDKAKEINIRWEASWTGASSDWLFDLADQIGWEVETKVADSTRVSTFSWKRVGQMFQKAFQTGTITLPVYVVEGSTRLRVSDDDTTSQVRIHMIESIDLVREADRSRLQNRIVAQEFASWLDVSRRPLQMEELVWAAIVRERVLVNVPGAGALDVDPNEDGPGVFYAFGIACLAAFGLLYQFLAEEVNGG